MKTASSISNVVETIYDVNKKVASNVPTEIARNYRRDQQKSSSEVPTDTAATTDVTTRSLRKRYLPTQQQLQT
jgi:hypothetical protein